MPKTLDNLNHGLIDMVLVDATKETKLRESFFILLTPTLRDGEEDRRLIRSTLSQLLNYKT